MDLRRVSVNRLSNKLGKGLSHIMKANLGEMNITEKASITMATEAITRASGKTASITDTVPSIPIVEIKLGLDILRTTKRLKATGLRVRYKSFTRLVYFVYFV